MSPLESILYVIWRGVAIGILISAPMGPVGILCIQRTLDKGRKAGFYTGIGAAISDLIYCLLTGFCLSFIEDFLNENQNVIQLVGSLVLIAFSVYLFKKNPSSGMRRPLPQNVSARKNILGGFLFTFSNPLIIFLIIGLFARFNFTIPEIKGYYYAIGYLFIIAGALGWWYGVTYGIDKVRSRFNMRSMKILNIIIGVVILCFAAVGIATSIVGLTSTDASARSTQPLPKTLIADTTINSSGPLAMLDSANACHYFRLDFKLRNVAASSSMKRYAWTDSAGVRHSSAMPPWSLTLEDRDARSYRMEFSIEEIETSQIDSQAAPVVRIYDPDGSLIFSRPILRGIAAASEWNHFRIIHTHGQPLTLLGGHTSLRCIFPPEPDTYFGTASDIAMPPDFSPQKIYLTIFPGGRLSVRDVRLTPMPAPGDQFSNLSLTEIEERLQMSSDPIEGRWAVFDSSMNEDLLRIGGDYKLAIIRRPDGCYEIIYLSGADVNAGAWEAGMLKGLMRPSGVATVYDLEWIDPYGGKLSRRLKAQHDSDALITLQFPYQSSTLRLHKIP